MTEQEKKEGFIEAWKTVFDVEEVKDDDNFFEVGGDSLKGVQLLGCLAEKGLKLDMLKIYTMPTVEEMVEELEEMDPVEIPQEIFTGQVTEEQLEKYLQDPSVRKAMADFGIREEDIRENVKTVDPAPAKQEAAEESGKQAPQGMPGAGSMPGFGMPPGAVPFCMLAPPAPGGAPNGPVQGYLVPVQLMMFIPAVGPDGKALPVPPGAIPFPMMPCPGNPSETQDQGGNEK